MGIKLNINTTMILKTYKNGKRIICYITKYNTKYSVRTGKPSDASCLGWDYDNLQDAEFTANEFFNNFTRPKLSVID